MPVAKSGLKTILKINYDQLPQILKVLIISFQQNT